MYLRGHNPHSVSGSALTAVLIVVLSISGIQATEPSPDRKPASTELLELKQQAQVENENGPLARRLKAIKQRKAETAVKGLTVAPEVVYATTVVIVGNFTDCCVSA